MFGSMDTTPVGEYVLDSFPGEWGIEDTNGTGVKVIRTTNFTNSGKLNLTDVITREIEMKKVNKKRIMKYDTILERSGGTTDNPVGRVVLFEEDGLYLCNNFTQVLRFKDIDPRFAFYSLFYFYQTNKTAIRGMGNKTTGIQNLNMSKYLGIGIPNASIEQQKAFTAIAEQADKSKFMRSKSQFIEMFGGNQYKQAELDTLAKDWQKGQAFKKDNLMDDGKYKCIHYGELFTKYGPIIDSVLSSTDDNMIKGSKKGDILFPASDVTPVGLARCSALMLDDVLLGGDIIVLRPQAGIIPEYLSWAINMQKDQLLKRVTGSVVRHMSAKGLKSVTVPIPPKEIQQHFISIVKQADKSKFELKKAIEAIDKVIKSLINENL